MKNKAIRAYVRLIICLTLGFGNIITSDPSYGGREDEEWTEWSKCSIRWPKRFGKHPLGRDPELKIHNPMIEDIARRASFYPIHNNLMSFYHIRHFHSIELGRDTGGLLYNLVWLSNGICSTVLGERDPFREEWNDERECRIRFPKNFMQTPTIPDPRFPYGLNGRAPKIEVKGMTMDEANSYIYWFGRSPDYDVANYVRYWLTEQ